MPAAARRRPVTFTQAPDGTVTLQPADLPTWQQYITDFDSAVSQAQAVLADLQSQGSPTDPTALEAYNKLLSDGQSWITKLQGLQSMRDSVASWASGLVAETSDPFVQIALSGAPARAGQLGIVPLVIAGIGLASFAAVVYGALQWAQQAQRFSQLNTMAQASIAKGADPTSAYQQAGKTLNITAGAPGGGFFASLGSNIVWTVALGLLAVIFLPKLIDRLSGPRGA